MTANPRAWGHGPRFANSLVTLLIALALSACAQPVLAPGASSGLEPEPTPADRIHQQAHDALVRWADAVRASGGATITFTGELTSQIGAWDAAAGENNKVALLAGMVEAKTPLPDDTPSRSEVKWLDGTKVDVNILSAADALAALVAGASGTCEACTPLRVTGASLATALVQTSRGPANAPTWVFALDGSSVQITRVAVDKSITVTPPPWNANDPPVGVSIDSAFGTADSRKLAVQFTGAIDDASDPCGATYEAEAVESEIAVVVIVFEHKNDPAAGCRLVGYTRTAEVRLASKLGERAVLEIRQGLPVPVVAPG